MLSLKSIPEIPRLLGLAGILPQMLCVLLVMFGGPEYRYAALSIGYAYAVIIFSFLGGMWWGLAAGMMAADHRTLGWIYFAAVMPSLLALISFLPWVYGENWPEPSLILLGLGIALSPLVDHRLREITPAWWMPLRLILSLALGMLTLLMGLI
jgi:Protein of unknown function (DUF3429)